MILTNPPFGGEEERGILGNFPEDKQTAETALLFLQLIMRKLRRAPHEPGRAGGGRAQRHAVRRRRVRARIKEELLTEFNLHTIVRLPNGVFAPYTSIPTNLLFFDRSGPTEDIWYYELPLPEGRKKLHQDQAAAVTRSSPTAWPGGATGRRTSTPGGWPRGTCSSTTRPAAWSRSTWTSRTPTPRPTWSTCRRSSWWRASWRRSGGSLEIMAEIKQSLCVWERCHDAPCASSPKSHARLLVP